MSYLLSEIRGNLDHDVLVDLDGVALITEHDVVDAILRHLERKEAREARGPPN